MTPHLDKQIKISKMLSYGFVFTIMPSIGMLSILSLIIGVKARRMIKQSESRLSGIVLAWWCIIVGGINTLAFIVYVVLNWVGNPWSSVK